MCATCCPECRELLEKTTRLREGERITCARCGAHLEVITLIPLELDWVYAEPCQTPDEFDEGELKEPDII
jgi:uncharacterized protein YbaR (Trm112 family)